MEIILFWVIVLIGIVSFGLSIWLVLDFYREAEELYAEFDEETD